MNTLSQRQQALLATIIHTYIDSAKPVSSGELVDHDGLDVSPATIRNEMAALTDAGYLVQPHTSAGRIPSERAWRWYISQVDAKPLSRREQAILNSVVETHRAEQDQLLRQVAKTMAALADESVLVAHGHNDTYYTGLSNLFSQPEFETADLVQHVSRVIDQLDDVLTEVSAHVADDVSILVGRENPFSVDCGLIVTRYRTADGSGLIAILGPVRQDYDEHLALMNYTKALLANV